MIPKVLGPNFGLRTNLLYCCTISNCQLPIVTYDQILQFEFLQFEFQKNQTESTRFCKLTSSFSFQNSRQSANNVASFQRTSHHIFTEDSANEKHRSKPLEFSAILNHSSLKSWRVQKNASICKLRSFYQL